MFFRPFSTMILALCFMGAPAFAQQVLTTSAGQVRLEVIAEGLDTPWAVAPLPTGGALITERGGRLVFAADGRLYPVSGAPRVRAQGQGGLLDITLARDFGQSRELFLAYSRPRAGGGAGTAVAAARLSADNRRLTQLRTIFEAAPGSTGGRHFGSRVVEAADGTLFVTIGDRGRPASAQDRSNHDGSVIRIRRDGGVPVDNPLVGKAGVRPEIWSWGHRNPQGAALDGRGRLWTSEHGARGGDEINLIRKGANYGWPVISYGTEYSGARIGEGTHKAGMEQPQFYWDPSIAPSGLMIYSGRLWPAWRGHLFVGSLKFDHIARLAGEPLRAAEQIAGPQTERLRDIVEAPDGTIWFVSEGRGAVYRMSPAS